MVVGQLSWLTEEDESLSLSPFSWCSIVLEKVARITLLYVSLPSPGTSFPAYSLCDRNAIDLWDLLPFLGDECQLSMLRRCHCYPRLPSVPGGGYHCSMQYTNFHWRIISIDLVFNEFFSIQDLFGELSYQVSILPMDFIHHGKFSWPFISLGDT